MNNKKKSNQHSWDKFLVDFVFVSLSLSRSLTLFVLIFNEFFNSSDRFQLKFAANCLICCLYCILYIGYTYDIWACKRVCVCVCVRFVLGKIRLLLSAVLALARDLIQLLCFMPFWYQTFFITSASSLTHSLFLSLSLVCTMHFVEFLLFSYKPNKFAHTEYCLYVAVVLDELMLQRIYVYVWMLREATEKSRFFFSCTFGV